MKRTVLILLIFFTSTLIHAQTYVIKSDGGLNLRSAGNTNAAIITKIPNGAEVKLSDKGNGEWWRVTYNGQTGYVSSKYLAENKNNQKVTENKSSANTSPNNTSAKKEEAGNPADTGKCFDANTHLLSLGIGFRGGYYNVGNGYGYTHRISSVYSINYEQALKKKLGPGYLGIGAYFAFQTEYQQNNYNYKFKVNGDYYDRWRWNYYMIAARAAYHLDVLNSKKAELYFGAVLGLRINKYTYYTNNPNPDYHNNIYNENYVYPALCAFVGGRYYFTKQVAVYSELGYGISYFTIGLNVKF